ncbi:MarR family winged helix-turn-helix transcriptional regulator [Nocardioides gilvus]|uniref:MarR family winged helix-turn-helix transcriptional regulator n=1 Tax=Nocardioides gilvus TaxID=1735589 RepID=UPI001951C738|nr:MarR family winged helix-turn-helix transcriptional regulator [Nocardioides gilvus]
MSGPSEETTKMNHVTRGVMGTPVWDVLVATARLDRARQLSDAHADLVMAQRRLLWLLMDGEPHTMRDIAEQLQLEQSTVNRQVNAAITAGLLERVKAQGESAHSLTVTEKGLAVFSADVARAARHFEAALGALPDGRAEEYVKLMGVFASAYRDAVDAEVGAVPPAAAAPTA